MSKVGLTSRLPKVTKAGQLELAELAVGEPKNVSKARILIVDDDTIVQQFLTEILTAEGYEVEILGNGDDVLERLGSEDYNVILLDIKLPGMSGFELYEHIKGNRSLAGRVVFITGDTMSVDTITYLFSARIPYFIKPFDIEKLLKGIDRILSQQSRSFESWRASGIYQ